MRMQETLITDQDRGRLRSLVNEARTPSEVTVPDVGALRQGVSGARVVSQKEIPRNVVTMNSLVALTDMDTGARLIATLVYPRDGRLSPREVPVTTPLGAAMLGKRVGQIIRWPRGTKDRRLRIQRVMYQPEAAGDLNL